MRVLLYPVPMSDFQILALKKLKAQLKIFITNSIIAQMPPGWSIASTTMRLSARRCFGRVGQPVIIVGAIWRAQLRCTLCVKGPTPSFSSLITYSRTFQVPKIFLPTSFLLVSFLVNSLQRLLKRFFSRYTFPKRKAILTHSQILRRKYRRVFSPT